MPPTPWPPPALLPYPPQVASGAAIAIQRHTDRRDNCMKTHKTQVRQDRQHRCKAIDMLLQHHAVTHTIAIATCCSYSTTGSHAWQQLHDTRADATMHSPAHTDMAAGLLTRFRWRTRGPQSLSDQNTHCPGTPRMPSHGRRRQEHPDKAIAEPLCMVLPHLGGGNATSRWPWRSDPRVSTAKARIRPLASRDTARRRADPAPNRRRQARLADASNWRQTA